MKNTDLDCLVENVKKDISSCSQKELDQIYKAIKNALKKFDRDKIFKNTKDFIKSLFKTKKQKCLLFVEDIVDSKDKLTDEEKESLRKTFLDISNIHRTFIENLIALFEAL